MGRAHVNIWILEDNCTPINGCWKIELKIKTCTGAFVQNFDPEILNQLKGRYPEPDFLVNSFPDRIVINNVTHNYNLNHIELDVIPLCYIFKARVCFNRNEETSPVVRFLNCEDRSCVRLLVPAIKNCGNDIFHPAGIEALRLNVMHDRVRGYIHTVAKAGKLNLTDLQTEAQERISEATELGLPSSDIVYMQDFKNLIDEVISELQ